MFSMGAMKGITIKLPETAARQLRQQACQSGRSVSEIVRDLIEVAPQTGESVYAVTADLAGCLSGSRWPATNARRKFWRS